MTKNNFSERSIHESEKRNRFTQTVMPNLCNTSDEFSVQIIFEDSVLRSSFNSAFKKSAAPTPVSEDEQ